MQMFIPTIGFTFQLSEDWKFSLHNEHRNDNLMDRLGVNKPIRGRGGPDSPYDWTITFPEDGWSANGVTYPAGTVLNFKNDSRGYGDYFEVLENLSVAINIPKHSVLKVDRIYIRKGNSDFDSLTFIIKESLGVLDPKRKIPGSRGPFRFWAKLDDVNKVNFVPV